MNQTKSFLLIAGVVLLIISMNRCKTSKLIQSGPSPDRTESEVLNALRLRNVEYNRFNAKADLSFQSPDQSASGSMQLRMVKDSVIWMVVKKFGIEAARALIRPDSAFLLYRFDHVCQQGSVKEISGKYGLSLDFNSLQQIMAGNIVVPNSTEIISYRQTGNQCTLITQQHDLHIKYVVDGFTLNLIEMYVNDKSERSLIIKYSDYRKIKNSNIPYKRDIFVESDLTNTVTMEISIDEIEINVQKATTFSIPESYDRYTF